MEPVNATFRKHVQSIATISSVMDLDVVRKDSAIWRTGRKGAGGDPGFRLHRILWQGTAEHRNGKHGRQTDGCKLFLKIFHVRSSFQVYFEIFMHGDCSKRLIFIIFRIEHPTGFGYIQ